MVQSSSSLRSDAERIWRAGVDAVRPQRLIPAAVQVDGQRLLIGGEKINLPGVGRIAVVGAGKAGAEMAVALEDVLGDKLMAERDLHGWINVPADCILPTRRIHLHAARPAGINEPRPEGVHGTQEILRIVGVLDSNDLCFCLISGGGSALLPCPVPGISLDDKIHLTRTLSAAGANIEQLNAVRRALSQVKGGGLARQCRAGRLVSLIISDVLGDPLESIASGPTAENPTTAPDALDILRALRLDREPSLRSIAAFLDDPPPLMGVSKAPLCQVTNLVIGNNATAVEAAGRESERLGYTSSLKSAQRLEGPAEEVGRGLADQVVEMQRMPIPIALISGGEPTVELVDESRRGKGGRNQQLVLAALKQLVDCRNFAFLSGGTDGEDGPTDAAGAIVDQEIAARAKELRLSMDDYLIRNDAYHFFESVSGLFKTGPTHTNVGDLRVAVLKR